ncbi:CPBP family intramembrane metalloprotease [Aestuariibaculum sp. TT11]|uniref:CPBP family intramembrane metalloprotease n=2 Tax=Aestuariibaculum sediminum TaxID=2770637 RepID=A0A8J6PZG0_9FLAO|nr:CPBP family intramembrane metalloprotease [Aestuariibaculum sediminum]
MLLSFAVGLLALFLVVKYLHKQSFTQLTTSRKTINWKRFWFVFVLWGVISSSLVLVDYFMSPENYMFNFKLVPFLFLCLVAIIFVPLQTSFEEYMFRGYLMQGIGVFSTSKKFPLVSLYILIVIFLYFGLSAMFSMGLITKFGFFIIVTAVGISLIKSRLAEKIMLLSSYNTLFKILNRNTTSLIITSMIFGLLHIANPEVDKLGPVIMVYYIGTGLFLGIMTLMDEGMELALGFHAANNLFTALLVTADWTAFQTHSILKDMSDPSETALAEIFVPVFVVFPVMLFILAKVYKWSNWNQKLLGRVINPNTENQVGID